MKLHEKIYISRKKCGLSQEDLAEKLGISRQAVSKWETGETIPELSKIKQLKEIFNVSFDWLLSENEENQSPDTKPVSTKNISESNLIKQNSKILNIHLMASMIIGSAVLTIIGCALIVYTILNISSFSVLFYILVTVGIAMITGSGLIIRYLIRNKKGLS